MNGMSEVDFISHIVSAVCNYAKENGYLVNDTLKTIGENLIFLTEIATFDNWESNSERKPNLRLVSADAVKEIISKYEHRQLQRTMIFEIEQLSGCLATQEQVAEIIGDEDIKFQD